MPATTWSVLNRLSLNKTLWTFAIIHVILAVFRLPKHGAPFMFLRPREKSETHILIVEYEGENSGEVSSSFVSIRFRDKPLIWKYLIRIKISTGPIIESCKISVICQAFNTGIVILHSDIYPFWLGRKLFNLFSLNEWYIPILFEVKLQKWQPYLAIEEERDYSL